MAKEQKPKKWVRQQMILSAMKKVFVKSPMYKAVKDSVKSEYKTYNKDGSESKAKRVHYLCKLCNKHYTDKKIEVDVKDAKGRSKKKKIYQMNLDHCSPVINPLTGYTTIDDWVNREFVGIDLWDPKINSVKDLEGKLQYICWYCHNSKSIGENSIRIEIKKGKKNE